MYATHQRAKYSSDKCREHGEAIIYPVNYSYCTCNLGLKFKPNLKKGFDCFCDADLIGNWNMSLASSAPSSAKSDSGWIIFYATCPIIWAFKLQSQVVLSTTEAEYIVLTKSLQTLYQSCIYMKNSKCLSSRLFALNLIYNSNFKAFEDNTGALELAKLP